MTGTAPSPPPRKGLIGVFTGNGKGETSAAFGMVLRAIGHDLRVCMVHFMKSSHPPILKGRYADRGILERAGLVTEMVDAKHPYDSGVEARPGFDFQE